MSVPPCATTSSTSPLGKRRELSADDVLRGGQAKKLHQLLHTYE